MPNVASSAEEIAVIQRLINAGANINSTGKKEGGWTALMVAANSSNVPLVTFLLNQKGINTSIRSREVDEPGWKQPSQSVYDLAADKPEIQSLLHAFAKKHLNDQSFVASGPSDIIADYLHGTPETPKTAQQATNDPYAFIKDNDLEGLAEWIHQEKKRNPRFDINAARFDLNTDDLDGDKKYPLLALAAKENKPEIIQFLLNIMGADLKARGSDNETALHIAALFGRSESTAVLIGADPSRATIDAEAAYLQTPLMYVARSPMTDEHLNVAKLLIEANANVNAKDWESFTPLMDAASQGNYPLVELLLAHGARASDTRLTPEGHHEAAIDHIADDAPNNAELRALLEKHMATEAAQKATHTHAEEKTDQAEKEGKSTDAE